MPRRGSGPSTLRTMAAQLAARAARGESAIVRRLVAGAVEHVADEAETALAQLRAACTHPPGRVVLVWVSPRGEPCGFCYGCFRLVLGR